MDTLTERIDETAVILTPSPTLQNVRLITSTPKIEQHVAYCARVSNPPNQLNTSYRGLLKYCMRHSHWSVFEHGFITMEITTSRTLSRQLLRHRSFYFQEFSQRYAQVQDRPILFNARSQDHCNRQNSIDNCSEEVKDWFLVLQSDNWNAAVHRYTEALGKGIAKEQARVLLPEGASPTTLYMSGNLRSWIHFIQLRGGNGTQLEMQQIAWKCLTHLREVAPTIANILSDSIHKEVEL